jgi:hypothetical protein
MAAWPDVARVKRRLGITDSSLDAEIASVLAAAIEQVERDCAERLIDTDQSDPWPGGHQEYVLQPIAVPTASQAEAALLLSVMIYKAPDAPHGIAAVFDTGGLTVASQHPTYLRLLVGQRHATAFPIA